MEDHYDPSAAEYTVEKANGFRTVKPQYAGIDADAHARPFRDEVKNKSEIAELLFTGFRKCLQDSCKFQSDPERVFSVMLEDDSDSNDLRHKPNLLLAEISGQS